MKYASNLDESSPATLSAPAFSLPDAQHTVMVSEAPWSVETQYPSNLDEHFQAAPSSPTCAEHLVVVSEVHRILETRCPSDLDEGSRAILLPPAFTSLDAEQAIISSEAICNVEHSVLQTWTSALQQRIHYQHAACPTPSIP